MTQVEKDDLEQKYTDKQNELEALLEEIRELRVEKQQEEDKVKGLESTLKQGEQE